MPCPRGWEISSDKAYFFSAAATILPPFLVQSAAVFIVTQPLPLQPFFPAQLLSAPEQAPWPLQSLTPAHFTSPVSLAVLSAARAAPAANIEATAEARTARFQFFMATA